MGFSERNNLGNRELKHAVRGPDTAPTVEPCLNNRQPPTPPLPGSPTPLGGQDNSGNPKMRSHANAELHRSAATENPIAARGEAGAGAAALAQRIATANSREPTAGRAYAVSAYERGVAGEQAIAEALQWLPGNEFWVLHDQPWPNRPKANIDHIVVGRAGIFVIDSKNWSGHLTISNQEIQQNGKSRAAATQGCSEQKESVLKMVRGLSFQGSQNVQVQAVLAFTSPKAPHGQIGDVTVLPMSELAPFIGNQPENIPVEALHELVYKLEEALTSNRRYTLNQYHRSRRMNAAAAGVARQNNYNQDRPSQATYKPKPRQNHKPKRRISRSRVLKTLTLLALVGVVVLKPDVVENATTFVGDLVGSFVASIVDGKPS